jgi:uncharacterized protein
LPDDALPAWLRTGSDFITIELLARPGSQRRGVLRIEARGPVIGVTAAAEKGKANAELIAIVAELAEVPRAAVTIVRGDTARTKVVRIATSKPSEVAEIARRLATLKPHDKP